MPDTKSNLQNLLDNYKRQLLYSDYTKANKTDRKDMERWNDIDVNTDGKITAKDKSEILKEEKALLKSADIFDVNNDDKIDYNDLIRLSSDMDIDKNGNIDEYEKEFLKAYKSKIKSSVLKNLSENENLSIADLMSFETAISKMDDESKKFWKSEIASIESKMKLSLKSELNKSQKLQGDEALTVDDLKNFWKETKNIDELENTSLKNWLNSFETSYISIVMKNDAAITIEELQNIKEEIINEEDEEEEEPTIPEGEKGSITFLANIMGDANITSDYYTQTVDDKGRITELKFKTGTNPNALKDYIIEYNDKNNSFSVSTANGQNTVANITKFFNDTDKLTKISTFNLDNTRTDEEISDTQTRIFNYDAEGNRNYFMIDDNKNDNCKFENGKIIFANGYQMDLEANSSVFVNKDGSFNIIQDAENEGYKSVLIYDNVYSHGLKAEIPSEYYKNKQITSFDTEGKITYFEKEINNKLTVYTDELEYVTNRTKSIILQKETADISEALLSDIEIVKEAEENALDKGAKGTNAYNNAYNSYIKSQMIKTPETMENKIGEVVEKPDGLYINDGSANLVKLNISAQTYLTLFPPIERYDIAQGQLGDCFYISSILSGSFRNPKTFSKIIQMFSENNQGDITVTFNGMPDYPVTFYNGELRTLDGLVDNEPVDNYTQLKGAKGMLILEQAFAIAKFAEINYAQIDEIDIDSALKYIDGGNVPDTFNSVFGENLTEYANIQYNNDLSTIDTIPDNVANEFKNLSAEYLDSKKKVIDSDKELTQLDFMNETYIDLVRSITGSYYNHFNRSLWQDGLTNGQADIEKFKNLPKAYSSLDTDLTDAQWETLINILSKKEDYAQLTAEYETKDNELYDYHNNKQKEGINLYSCYSIIYHLDPTDKTIADLNNLGLIEFSKQENEAIRENQEQYINNIAEAVNNKQKVFCSGCMQKNNDYSLEGNHMYYIDSIDTQNRILKIINPWYGGLTFEISYDLFIDAFVAYCPLTTTNL